MKTKVIVHFDGLPYLKQLPGALKIIFTFFFFQNPLSLNDPKAKHRKQASVFPLSEDLGDFLQLGHFRISTPLTVDTEGLSFLPTLTFTLCLELHN